MLGYYVTDALRNVTRRKLYSSINIAGLAVGLACVIFISLFVRDELSYDKWIPQTDNLYRIEATIRLPALPPVTGAATPFPLAIFMKEHLPQVAAITHFSPQHMTVNVGQQQYLEVVAEVDPNFFQVVRLPVVIGDPTRFLAQSETAVITEAVARKYFGDTNPIGKTIGIARASCGPEHVSCSVEEQLRVTGIVRDLPYNTQLAADIFIPHTSTVDRIQAPGKREWLNLNTFSYLRLAKGAEPKAVLARLSSLLDRYVDLKSESGTNSAPSKLLQVFLVPFVDVHLGANGRPGDATGGWTTLYGLCLIALLILSIASFNFINLATARAALRAREVALRKCVGASRFQLVAPFLIEAMLMAFLALLFALSIVEMLLPQFSQFLQRPMELDYISEWKFFALMVGIALLTGLACGTYPALVLSSVRPGFVLRNSSSGQAGSGRLRTILVVLQFSVSIGLAIVGLVVYSQISYARHIEMGFNHDSILTIDAQRRLTEAQREAFASALRRNPGVLNVAMSSYVPLTGSRNTGLARIPGVAGQVGLEELSISPEFPQLYGMRLLAGRWLSEARTEDAMFRGVNGSSDGTSVLINAAAAARFEFSPEQAIGKRFNINGSNVRVVGVLSDARMEGALQSIRPAVLVLDKQNATTVSVLLSPDYQADTVSFIDRTWRSFAPTVAISRSFLSGAFEKLYEADEKQGEILGVFVIIAMSIACLGLFGLASFTAERRTKEIGIRKVFGASTRDIVLLLLWQFSIPVLIANVIAWPVAWFYLRGWLNGFADHVPLSPIYFAGPAVVAMSIAWVTVFTHAVHVAGASPIHALRHE